MNLQNIKKFLGKYQSYIIALIISIPVLWIITHPEILSRYFDTFQDITEPPTTTGSITTTSTESIITSTTESPTTTPVDTKCSVSQINTIDIVKIPAV